MGASAKAVYINTVDDQEILKKTQTFYTCGYNINRKFYDGGFL